VRTRVAAAGTRTIQVMTPEGWVADTAEFFASTGFWERDAGLAVERFGPIARARSVYEASRHEDYRELEKRGVNFLNLFHDGRRWWITSVIWTDERADLPLPGTWLDTP
jgi:hypothetical protein